jgi:hypothetical protein
VAIVPLPPGLLITTTCCPRTEEAASASGRIIWSVEPPAGKATTRATGFVGNAASRSPRQPTSAEARASESRSEIGLIVLTSAVLGTVLAALRVSVVHPAERIQATTPSFLLFRHGAAVLTHRVALAIVS